MLEMREQRELKRFFGQVENYDLIILDELGYVPFTKLGAELFFEIVSRSYERLSLIVTTNLPFEQWTEVMGSERLKTRSNGSRHRDYQNPDTKKPGELPGGGSIDE